MSGFEKKAGDIFEATQPAASHCCWLLLRLLLLLLLLLAAAAAAALQKTWMHEISICPWPPATKYFGTVFLVSILFVQLSQPNEGPQAVVPLSQKTAKKSKSFHSSSLPNVPFPYNLNRKTVIKVKTPSNQQPFLLAFDEA